MNQYKCLPALILLALLTACGNGLEEGSATAPATTTPPPVTIQPAKPQSTTTAATSTAGLNPAHGQPGHRCDIQVGAPLNSAPAKPTTITTTQQPAVVLPQSTTTPAATSTAGLNPAHGQPGHRCDIAVGAPLPKQ
jgi:hypothetical protein